MFRAACYEGTHCATLFWLCDTGACKCSWVETLRMTWVCFVRGWRSDAQAPVKFSCKLLADRQSGFHKLKADRCRFLIYRTVLFYVDRLLRYRNPSLPRVMDGWPDSGHSKNAAFPVKKWARLSGSQHWSWLNTTTIWFSMQFKPAQSVSWNLKKECIVYRIDQ